MASDIRIPFGEALSEPRLLGPLFQPDPETGIPFFSTAQSMNLKAIYGVPLSAVKDDRGFSELDYWAASQGFGDYDELGYLKFVTPHLYIPREYPEAWGICGIRAGKTDRLAATVVAYEAVCGGHEAFVRKGRPVVCFQIAQDIRMAKYSLHSIRQTLESMAFLKANSASSWITNVTADRIELKNGVTIATTPPTVKSIRGYDSPVAVLDEVGVWYQDADSANPDFEIYNQVSSRQAQFQYPKIIGISSPWNRKGLLFERFEAGTAGIRLRCDSCRANGPRIDCAPCAEKRREHRNRLILHSTTAASNPIIPRIWLESERDKDPRKFERECLGIFQDSMSGFLSSTLVEKARARGILSRPAAKGNFYIAAMDPAFRNDAFAFTIVHADPAVGIVQDYVARWHDPTAPLNPGEIFPQIAQRLHEYGIHTVHSDQYTLESLQYLAQQFGFAIEEVTFSSGSKAEIYGNLQQLLNQGRLSLLDHSETIAELKSVERKNTQGGLVKISAPEGQHDDMATVIAIASYEAVWMLPKIDAAAKQPKAVSLIEKHIAEVAKRRRFISSHARSADDW